MQRELNVPVFDGTACAVKLVEDLNEYGVTTAKVAAYLSPERKELIACPGSLASIYETQPAGV
jgi:allantoin racemase